MCIVARERLNKSNEYTSVFAQDMMRFVPICFYSYSLEKTGSYIIINSEYTRISPSLGFTATLPPVMAQAERLLSIPDDTSLRSAQDGFGPTESWEPE